MAIVNNKIPYELSRAEREGWKGYYFTAITARCNAALSYLCSAV